MRDHGRERACRSWGYRSSREHNNLSGSMITRQEEPRRRNVFEIAIAVSIALHLLFGGVFFPLAHLMKIPEPRPTEQPLVALSDVVTIEKRTVPRPHPLAQPRPVTPQKQI